MIIQRIQDSMGISETERNLCNKIILIFLKIFNIVNSFQFFISKNAK